MVWGRALKDAYLTVFRIARGQEAVLAELRAISFGSQKVGVFIEVLNLLYSFGVGNEGVDKIIWTSSSSDGKFSMRSSHEVLAT